MKDVIYVTPQQACVEHQTKAQVVALKYSEKGFYPIFTPRTPKELNPPEVTEEIQESAVMGSMFGWDVPGANLAREFLESRMDVVDPAPAEKPRVFSYLRFNDPSKFKKKD